MSPLVKNMGCVELIPVWKAMQDFTRKRASSTRDEIWELEHFPIFTLGLAGKPEHILNARNIPVAHLDRGGQATYHGPGQIIIYLLLDLRRKNYGVKELVYRLENAVINLLAGHGVTADRKASAPGVYVDGAKIAALGLRVKHGCCYHGLALNTAMDISPFLDINPCGYPGLTVTQISELGIEVNWEQTKQALVNEVIKEIIRD